MCFTGVTEGSTASQLYTKRKNNINTAELEAQFLAQCACETTLRKWLKELGGEFYFSDKAYGYKYRGAGYIQLTGDYNYQAFANAVGDDQIYNIGADYVASCQAWQAAGWW